MRLIAIKKRIILLTLVALNAIIYPLIASADEINEASDALSVEDNTKKVAATTSDAIGNMLLQSVSLMGIAYKWGGNTPDTGMDCSGFVRYVFQKSLGITLPRTAAEMAKVGKKVSPDDLEPGDLIFFNTKRGSNTHIGIYLGNDKFIQAPRTGETIKISDFNGWWRQHFNGAKRVVQENVDDNGNATLESYQDIHNEALPTHYRSPSKSRHQRASAHGSHQRKRNLTKSAPSRHTKFSHKKTAKIKRKRH